MLRQRFRRCSLCSVRSSFLPLPLSLAASDQHWQQQQQVLPHPAPGARHEEAVLLLDSVSPPCLASTSLCPRAKRLTAARFDILRSWGRVGATAGRAMLPSGSGTSDIEEAKKHFREKVRFPFPSFFFAPLLTVSHLFPVQGQDEEQVGRRVLGPRQLPDVQWQVHAHGHRLFQHRSCGLRPMMTRWPICVLSFSPKG